MSDKNYIKHHKTHTEYFSETLHTSFGVPTLHTTSAELNILKMSLTLNVLKTNAIVERFKLWSASKNMNITMRVDS